MEDGPTEILAQAAKLAAQEAGGTLATMHAEDGTPYVSYVFFHLREDGDVVFGSMSGPQHVRNIEATPEVSFLIDNREVIEENWREFDRIVIEGRAELIPEDDSRYEPYLSELSDKHEMAAQFTTDHGDLYCIHPRRLIIRTGVDPHSRLVEFQGQ